MKLTKILLTVVCCLAIAGAANATTIKDGILTYSAGSYLEGEPLKVGYDIFGYNYQAHMFNSSYFNAYANRYGYPPYEGDDDAYYQRLVDEGYATTIEEAQTIASGIWMWPYRDVTLQMKWNEAWLSNKDQDGDGKLDRHYGFPSYIGCGAWLTNHMSGSDVVINDKGKEKEVHWTYFVKIVAAPADVTIDGGIWYNADGVEIGPVIWGSFAIIQQVENDPLAGIHGKQYGSPAGPGFGQYKP